MYFIQQLLLNFKLTQQISNILSYSTFITKFNCTFKNIIIIIIIIIILLKFKFNRVLNLHNPHIASLIEAGGVTYNKLHYGFVLHDYKESMEWIKPL